MMSSARASGPMGIRSSWFLLLTNGSLASARPPCTGFRLRFSFNLQCIDRNTYIRRTEFSQGGFSRPIDINTINPERVEAAMDDTNIHLARWGVRLCRVVRQRSCGGIADLIPISRATCREKTLVHLENAMIRTCESNQVD